MSFIFTLLFFLPFNFSEQQTSIFFNETSTIGKLLIFTHFSTRKTKKTIFHFFVLIDIFLSVCLGGALTDASLNNNRLIPKTISEYPSPINVRTKYTSDEEDYTSTESISFALLTTQQGTQTATTVLAGFAYDNIYYVFDLEVCSSLNRKPYRFVFVH